MRPTVSRITASFTESVIREMTRLTILHDAVNLSQGMPDFPAPRALKEAATEAIRDDVNQYSITWGAGELREAVAEKASLLSGVDVDPEREVTVTCGATEAMIATLTAIVDPGDEVIVFEPFYENYGPDIILSRAVPRFVPLRPQADGRWLFDEEEIKRSFGPKTRAIIINTPNNPTGKVFTREELKFIASLCVEWDVYAVTDEIYEHIIYDGAKHVSMAGIEGMRDRTITVNSISKTYGVTGWRVGWAIAPPEVTNAIRKVHDFLTVGAPSPLQAAAAVALRFDEDYYHSLAEAYLKRRDHLLRLLTRAGFRCWKPEGAYYIMTDAAEVMAATGQNDDVTLARWMIEEIGVSTVPGSSFYRKGDDGKSLIRFCFCKNEETLDEAGHRLSRLPSSQ